eukprot:TRINITY_DN76494_c0_g1_i1.p1 TRINITY_DN76494_c0_g1~~TRINITY_DN76494_c0_g1_i1.p1  ORF type:complete len:235 (-),score=91.08 TRINITY_DN76494_c0_g1_i1:56-760(-)
MTHLTIRQPEEKSLSQKQPAKTHTTLKMTAQDDRGFQKTDLVMWNPQTPNFQSGVNLVERDTCPNGYQLLDPDRSGKKTQHELVELAAHIQTADKFTRATAGSKLQIIADQLKYLQDQARKVLEDARLNALIHKTACNFKKVPGTTYYVYKNRKNPDTEFISMISPQEWGSASPEFCGGYRLEFDQSWTALADCDRKTNELMMIDRILDTDAQVSFSFLPSQYQAGIAIEQQKQ